MSGGKNDYRVRPRPRPVIKGRRLPVNRYIGFDAAKFIEKTELGEMRWELEGGRFVGYINQSVPIVVNSRHLCFIEWQGKEICMSDVPDGLWAAIFAQRAGWYD